MQAVYNLHITERCNYRCEFCFAKWGDSKGIWRVINTIRVIINRLFNKKSASGKEEIWKDSNVVHKILNALSDRKAAVRKFGESELPIRINFAGGEPLILGGKFLEIVKLAKEMGFETSIITNGSLLCANGVIYKYINLLGISVDSLNADTCRRIGRCDRNGNVLGEEQIKKLLVKARAENPGISVKFNVTVNRHNYKERVVERLQGFSPDRIKILRQLPFNGNPGITDEEYSTFLELNGEFLWENTVVEDNEDMTQSYLMIDPKGRFFQNGNGGGYIYSDPIHEVGLERALSQIRFNKDRFTGRYKDTEKKAGGSVKTNKITISGYAGTGKSTVGKMLAERLGYRFLSVGNFTREFAEKEFGMSINEFQTKCKEDPRLDDFVNLRFRDMCNGGESIVADFRLGFHFVENSMNILFVLSEAEAFKRLIGAGRKMEQTDFESMRVRNENMRRRFIDKYGVDFADENNYNLVINTDRKTPNEVVEQILAAMEVDRKPV